MQVKLKREKKKKKAEERETLNGVNSQMYMFVPVRRAMYWYLQQV